MGRGQYSYWFVRGYFRDSDEIRQCIDAVGCRHYAFIYHDRDVFLEDSESHNKGDPVKPHWHLCLNLVQASSWKVVKNRIESVVGTDRGLFVDDIHDTQEAKEYLFHKSKHSIDSDKFKYEKKDCYSDDLGYWDSDEAKLSNQIEKTDYLCDFIDEVLEFGFCPVFLLFKYKSLAKTNFIMKYERALMFCARCLGISYERIFVSPEHRALDEAKVIDNK